MTITIEQLVFLVAKDGTTRAEICALRVVADAVSSTAAAHQLARSSGFKNYDLVTRITRESGSYEDIRTNCVREPQVWAHMQREVDRRHEAHKQAFAARRNAA